jgi:hypothetical protein
VGVNIQKSRISTSGHGGRRDGAGRPKKTDLAPDVSSWLAELLPFGEPVKITPGSGFFGAILGLLAELAAVSGRDGLLAEMIEAELKDHDPKRRREIVLRCATLPARASILKQLVDAAAMVQRTSGRQFPWSGIDRSTPGE